MVLNVFILQTTHHNESAILNNRGKPNRLSLCIVLSLKFRRTALYYNMIYTHKTVFLYPKTSFYYDLKFNTYKSCTKTII